MKKFIHHSMNLDDEEHIPILLAEELTNPIPVAFETQEHINEKKHQSKSFFHSCKNLISVALFVAIYISPILQLYPTEHTCIAIVVFIIFLWSTDSTYFYVSAYLIPILSVWLQVGYDRKSGTRIAATSLAQTFSFIYMSPEILSFLMTITVFLAMDKLDINYFITKKILRFLQKPNPSTLLFTIMILNLLLSAFLSPVASTALILALTQPIIKSLDPSDSFSKALLIGIAWSGNCGFIPTIKMANTLPVSPLEYMIFSLPSSILLCIIESFYLVKAYKIKSNNFKLTKIDKKGDWKIEGKEKWQFHHYLIIFIVILSFFLLSFSGECENIGHEGIICLIPVVLIFGSGILTTNDFNSLSWSTLSLAGGSIALSETIKISGLFDFVFDNVFDTINDMGFSEFTMTVIFLFIVSIFASIFTDKMVIVHKLISLWSGSTTAIATSVLMVHVSQLFVSSTFANIAVTSVINQETGEPIISGSEFVKKGLVTVLFAVAVLSTVGYVLVSSLGL
ncbi:Sodium:sulfate symporter transmembrane region family protein [Tritrichomonas foetus]|uniref:Sodium:sulfate symporter transmembrane region family protein n=1 Tax=Tritrichomonas foetus TaxID=1144522 RepID=A0A1J4J294_9EUKA|nr:Sodium:sulfate symporter transmembrane region family protein [Tritrichomonas foetus]|eukprot:OHS93590.1 Sodium:sulfate symporter transmembrane region family protein [Tritrichomonas foetus]